MVIKDWLLITTGQQRLRLLKHQHRRLFLAQVVDIALLPTLVIYQFQARFQVQLFTSITQVFYINVRVVEEVSVWTCLLVRFQLSTSQWRVFITPQLIRHFPHKGCYHLEGFGRNGGQRRMSGIWKLWFLVVVVEFCRGKSSDQGKEVLRKTLGDLVIHFLCIYEFENSNTI